MAKFHKAFICPSAFVSLKTLFCLTVLLGVSSAEAAPLILGDTSGNTRGTNAVDIQSVRADVAQVAAGNDSTAIGQYNSTTGDYALAIGYENTATTESIAVGSLNYITGLGYAYGHNNLVLGGTPAGSYEPSAAFGISNTISSGANFSFAFGHNNTINSSNAAIFGFGITNSIANSTMIGPSDAAKVTILSTGNIGIGTAAPSSKLHVVGDLNVTGSIINSGVGTSGSGASSRLRVGGSNAPSGSWQGAAVIGSDGLNKVVTGYLANSTNGAVVAAHNSALDAWADLNLAGSNLIFRSGETEQMRISNSGNVGIGTATPAEKLHVAAGYQ